MEGRRSGDSREWELIDSPFPQQLARSGIHGVDIPRSIADERGEPLSRSRVDTTDADCSADGGPRLEHPTHATTRGIECVDRSALRAGIDTAASDCRLRVDTQLTGECERPLHAELWHVGSGQSRHGGVLISRVRSVDAPCAPAWTGQRIELTAGFAHR